MATKKKKSKIPKVKKGNLLTGRPGTWGEVRIVKSKLEKGARQSLAKHLKAPEKYKRANLVKDMKKLEKFYKSKAALPAKSLVKKGAKKGIARKLVGKLGVAGKAAVGASILYHYSKKSGCKPGMSKVKKGGKFYCSTSKGSKKGRDY